MDANKNKRASRQGLFFLRKRRIIKAVIQFAGKAYNLRTKRCPSTEAIFRSGVIVFRQIESAEKKFPQ